MNNSIAGLLPEGACVSRRDKKMPGTEPIRVLVVDDHPLMRSGIQGVVDAQSDMRVVAEASDGAEGILQFKIHRPDVTLMDIRMPIMGGVDAIRSLRKEFPNARVVVLSTSSGDINALRALQAGAMGYLLKNLLRTDLIETIRHIHAGQRRIPPEIAQRMAEHAGDDQLTARELDVLRGVSTGRSNKIIAANLDITENTVKNHVKSILSKLGARDRTDAVMIAMRRGYLEL